jgi:outer membrane immunogenic protein
MSRIMAKRTAAAAAGFLSLFATAPAASQMIPNWNGFYLGVTAGYVQSEMTLNSGDLASAGITAPGAVSGISDKNVNFGFVGGQNFQLGFIVWGWEADWSRYQSRASTSFTGSIAPFGAVTGNLISDVDWTGSLKARAGITLGDALVFASAGLVVAKTSGSISFSALGVTQVYADSALLTGWSLGGGIEYQIAPIWTLRAEVIHTHIGNDLFSFSTGMVPLSSSIDLLTVRAGMSIRF